MCYIKAQNIKDAHKAIIARILFPEKYLTENIGVYEPVYDEEGNITREVHNVLVTIENPLDEKNMVCDNTTKVELDLFAECHLEVESARDSGFIPGQRLYNFLGEDQFQKTVERLKDVPESRRASIITCNPLLDWDDEEERPPSLLLIDLKLRDNGKLVMTGVLRSNDMYRTWPANAYALAKLLEKFSQELGKDPGHLDILSISAHVYADDFEKAQAYLGR